MTKLEQAARQALVALEDVMADFDGSWALADTAITALREALAEQAEQEPVEWEPVFWGMAQDGVIVDGICPEEHAREEGSYTIPLYAAPVRTKDPCHPWQDLTDDEIISALGADMDTDEDKECFIEIVRLGIAADREKNK